MTKKTKSRNASNRKRASEEAVRTALSILEEMSKSGKEVHVMVIGPLFMLTFVAAVEKYESEGWYTLSTEDFDMNILPAMSETILVHPDGGIFLSRNSMAMTIEPEEQSAEELLARYPGVSKLIH